MTRKEFLLLSSAFCLLTGGTPERLAMVYRIMGLEPDDPIIEETTNALLPPSDLEPIPFIKKQWENCTDSSSVKEDESFITSFFSKKSIN